jgi:hypothetical protein
MMAVARTLSDHVNNSSEAPGTGSRSRAGSFCAEKQLADAIRGANAAMRDFTGIGQSEDVACKVAVPRMCLGASEKPALFNPCWIISALTQKSFNRLQSATESRTSENGEGKREGEGVYLLQGIEEGLKMPRVR